MSVHYNNRKKKYHNKCNFENKTTYEKILASRRKVVKTVIIMFMLFTISWMPYHLISITIDVHNLINISKENNTVKFNNIEFPKIDKTVEFLSEKVYHITLCLALSNSAINPIAFCLLNRGLRRILNTTINRLFRLNNSSLNV